MLIGIDLGKKVLQPCAVVMKGNGLWNKRMAPETVLSTLAELPPLDVVMEACGAARYSSREIQALGPTR